MGERTSSPFFSRHPQGRGMKNALRTPSLSLEAAEMKVGREAKIAPSSTNRSKSIVRGEGL